MDENKTFSCPTCKDNKNCKVSYKLCVLPKYMIIILDRGKNDSFDCHVDFDYNIDIQKYTEQIEDEKHNTKYELIASTFLYGASGAGHTVAFCKHFDNNYYLFNDSSFYLEELNKLKNNKAFLLFFERQND